MKLFAIENVPVGQKFPLNAYFVCGKTQAANGQTDTGYYVRLLMPFVVERLTVNVITMISSAGPVRFCFLFGFRHHDNKRKWFRYKGWDPVD